LTAKPVIKNYFEVNFTDGNFEKPVEWNIDAIVHEVGHSVEGSTFGVHESPAYIVWGDSKWAEIFQYDVYLKIGKPANAERLNHVHGPVSQLPCCRHHVVQNWFYPIYTNYGKSQVLVNYFNYYRFTSRKKRLDQVLIHPPYEPGRIHPLF
jgi:hypothetical protein